MIIKSAFSQTKRLVSITCFLIHMSLAILFMMHNFWFSMFFLSIAVLFLLQSSLGEVPRQRQSAMSARSRSQRQQQQSYESPKSYSEPEAEPISPQGGVARPWITWVRGLQQAAPTDLRSIIMTIFQRLFQAFFSGIAAGGLGRFMDSRLRSQRITEFRKALRGELKKVLSSATSSTSK